MAEEAFETVVAVHHSEIHRNLVRMTRRPGDADDLSQETFLRAFRAHAVLPAGSNVRAWLFAIATNLCRNYWRSESRRRRAYEAAGETVARHEEPRGEGAMVMEQAGEEIGRIVAALPLRQRLAFTLRKVLELEYEAIGRSLDCSADTARAHVFQALRKIRRGLDAPAGMRTESK
jgi:RNA polymerase sigma-70 factor (ECF subfamily)